MKTFSGKVTSNKMKLTAAVKVDTFTTHPKYKKRVKRSKTYLVHDEIGVKVGDTVLFQEIKPVSRKKRWKITQIVGKEKKDKS